MRSCSSAPRDQPFAQRMNGNLRPGWNHASDGTGELEPAPKELSGGFLQERYERRVTLQKLLDRPLPVALLQVIAERGHCREGSSDVLGGFLEVALDAVGDTPDSHRLVCIAGRPREAQGALRQVEGVLVPLENLEVTREAAKYRIVARRFRKEDRAQTEFRSGTAVYLRAQGGRE